MRVERIQSTPLFLYPERAADKLDAELKGTLTSQALGFEGKKRNQHERYRQTKPAQAELAAEPVEALPIAVEQVKEEIKGHIDVMA